MNSKQRIIVAVVGGVLAIGAAVGVGAAAAQLAGTTTDTGSAGQNRPGYGREAGQQIDTTQMAAALASKLGVDESAVKTALDKALSANRPAGQGSMPSGGMSGGAPGGGPGGMPSGMPSAGSGGTSGSNDSRRTEMLSAIATSVAKDLNLDQAKVLAALKEVWQSAGPGGGQPS